MKERWFVTLKQKETQRRKGIEGKLIGGGCLTPACALKEKPLLIYKVCKHCRTIRTKRGAGCRVTGLSCGQWPGGSFCYE